MGFNAGSGSTTQDTSPWEGQQPYLRDVFQQAQNNYRSGGPEFYDGNTVAPLSDVTQYGMGAMAARGAQGSQSEAAMNQYLQQALGMPGGPQSWTSQGAAGALDPSRVGGYVDMFNAPAVGDQAAIRGISGDISDPARSALTGAAAGGVDPALRSSIIATGGGPAVDPTARGALTDATTGGVNPAAQSMITGATGSVDPSARSLLTQGVGGVGDPARSTLEAAARGDFLNANPFLNQTYDNAARKVTENFTDSVMPGINATFGAGGRTGSALHGQAVADASGQLTDSLSQLSSDIFGGDYAAERGRQLDAAGTLGGFDLAGGDQAISAAGTLGNLDLANRGLTLDAGSTLGGLDLNSRGLSVDAAGTLGGLDQSGRGLSLDAMLGAGGLDSTARGQTIQAGSELGRFDQSGQAINLDARSRLLNDSLGRTDAAFGNFFNQQGNELDFFGRESALASNERLGAAGLVPEASGLDFQNIEAMVRAGQMTDDQAQRLINAERERFDYYQNLPELRLLNYANIVNQNPFSQSSSRGNNSSFGLEF